MDQATKVTTIDQYIALFPQDVQERLNSLRQLILSLAPQATEKIGYGMPTFVLHENLVHFAAYEKHIGFYPCPSGITQFAAELSRYKGAKGSVQFPLTEPLPLELIGRMVQFRVDEVGLKFAAQKK